MHRLWRYDVFRFAQNDVARFTRNDAMFAPMCPQAHIIRRSRHHWRSQHHLPKANIIQKTHLCLGRQKCVFLLAEREGFEPSVRDYRTHDFQSCALDQLSHLSVVTRISYHILRILSSTFLLFFKFFIFHRFSASSSVERFLPPLVTFF